MQSHVIDPSIAYILIYSSKLAHNVKHLFSHKWHHEYPETILPTTDTHKKDQTYNKLYSFNSIRANQLSKKILQNKSLLKLVLKRNLSLSTRLECKWIFFLLAEHVSQPIRTRNAQLRRKNSYKILLNYCYVIFTVPK